MTIRLNVTAFIASCLVSVAGIRADEPSFQALQDRVTKVIDETSPAVVSVVVSHNKNYPNVGNAKPGELGGYEPNRFEPRRFRAIQAPELDRLDLSLAENIADNVFGGGVVLDAEAGLVLTPHHLIDGAKKIYLRGKGWAGSYADIVAADAKSDLAVLRAITPPTGLKAIRFADVRWADGPNGAKANLRKGSMVIALGYPQASGVETGSPYASSGILSNVNTRSAAPPQATDATTPRPLHTYGGLMQVDARITLGSSGAAVLDLDGRLVGLGSSVAAVYGSEANGGYAIPMDANYRRIIEVLRTGREVEYGFLGVSPRPDAGGVQITSVSPGCPAASAGLFNGDVITAIDGHRLQTTDDLLHFVGIALAGTEVTVDFQRNNRPGRVPVRLAKNPNTLPSIASVGPPEAFGLQVDYQSVKFAGLGGGFRNQPPPNPPQGVVVRELAARSAAERAFQTLGPAKPGSWWVITHVDGKPVVTPNDFAAAVNGKARVQLELAESADPTNRQSVTLP